MYRLLNVVQQKQDFFFVEEAASGFWWHLSSFWWGKIDRSTLVSILRITRSNRISTARSTFCPVEALVSKYTRLIKQYLDICSSYHAASSGVYTYIYIHTYIIYGLMMILIMRHCGEACLNKLYLRFRECIICICNVCIHRTISDVCAAMYIRCAMVYDVPVQYYMDEVYIRVQFSHVKLYIPTCTCWPVLGPFAR